MGAEIFDASESRLSRFAPVTARAPMTFFDEEHWLYLVRTGCQMRERLKRSQPVERACVDAGDGSDTGGLSKAEWDHGHAVSVTRRRVFVMPCFKEGVYVRGY